MNSPSMAGFVGEPYSWQHFLPWPRLLALHTGQQRNNFNCKDVLSLIRLCKQTPQCNMEKGLQRNWNNIDSEVIVVLLGEEEAFSLGERLFFKKDELGTSAQNL